MSQAFAQDLVLQEMTINTTEIYSATNSITTGPHFTVTPTGDVTLATQGNIYMRSGTVVVGGGKLMAVNDTVTVTAIAYESVVLPSDFSVGQNYPNPFNPTTYIRYSLPASENVSIVIYNTLGQLVRNLLSQNQEAGKHTVVWDARSESGTRVGNGTYFYMVKAGEYTVVKKMVLLK